jgi:hypothetical protein
MNKDTVRKSLVTILALGLAVPVLAGCGGSKGTGAKPAPAGDGGTQTTTSADGAPQLTVPDGADDDTKKQYIMENAIADCMKKQGFTYTPHVTTATAGSTDGLDGEDYAQAKKFRQKYGFGIYAASVYPDDPQLPTSKAGARGNATADEDEKGLTPAQDQAYNDALSGRPPANAKTKAEADKIGGCEEKGRAKAYGPALSAAAEKKQEQARDEKNSENGLALNGDVQLVDLAQKFASCLTQQGITVTTTQPTGIVDMVRLNAAAAIPEHHEMSKAQAMPLLTKDIDLALKDLECGKQFRAAYFPKLKANPYYQVDG